MKNHAVCVSILLLLLLPLTESSSLKGCCTEYSESPVPVKHLKDYIRHDASYCNIRAIIFRTSKNRYICANPDSVWVKIAIQFVPERTYF